jgi:hypothetical protein
MSNHFSNTFKKQIARLLVSFRAKEDSMVPLLIKTAKFASTNWLIPL